MEGKVKAAPTADDIAKIGEKDWRDAFELIVADYDEAFHTMLTRAQFLGFDPAYTFKVLWYYADGNLKVLKAEIREILAFYIMRGTRYDRDRVRSTTDKDVIKRMDLLAQKYRIKGGVPAKKEDITIGRIAAVFPHFVIKMVAEDEKRHGENTPIRVVARETARALGLPKAMCFPIAAAIIPRSKEYDDLFEKYLLWAKEFTSVIYNSFKRDDVRAPTGGSLPAALEQQRSIAVTQRSSLFIPEAVRMDLMKTLGLLI